MAPEAEAFENPILDKIRSLFPQLNSPTSTFRIVTDGCDEGSIKIMGMTAPAPEGVDTDFLTCDEVNALIQLAGEIFAPEEQLG